jgi:hypothetical protein
MVVFWIGATGALATLRAVFMLSVTVTTCNYGVDENTGDCIQPNDTSQKRAAEQPQKRFVAFAGQIYLNILTAVTILAALELYVLTSFAASMSFEALTTLTASSS